MTGVGVSPTEGQDATLGPAAGAPTEQPIDSVLARLQALVRDKTRFEPEEVTPVDESEIRQPLEVRVQHQLTARLVETKINGFFLTSPQDNETLMPRGQAESEAGQRLRDAAQAVETALRAEPDRLDPIAEGLYLPAARKHWQLQSCRPCHGKGKLTCDTCWGHRREACWKCHRTLRMTCEAYGCIGGKSACSSCHGSGQVSRQVSYPASRSVSVNGQLQTEYYTDYRTESVTCTAYGCMGGRVNCITCSGTGQVQCNICHGLGDIQCRKCGGLGELICRSCDGSKSTGEAAWIEIDNTTVGRLHWAAGADPAAEAIGQRHGLDMVVAEAGGVRWCSCAASPIADGGCAVTARYEGSLPIIRVETLCNDQTFRVVAFGAGLVWHDLDGILESLLSKDLEDLHSAIVSAADDGLFASDLSRLLPALGNVSASELNAELVEAALADGAATITSQVVSEAYVQRVRSGVLGSLRVIYLRSAKRLWWKAAAAMVVVVVLAAWLEGTVWAAVAAVACLPAIWLWFQARLRARLTGALHGVANARRAMLMAVRGGRHYVANAVVLVPAGLAASAIVALWPAAHPTRPALPAPLVIQSPGSTPAPAAGSGAASLQEALAMRDAGRLKDARALLAAKAQAGDAAAAGPYAWMLLRGEGQESAQKASDAEVLALADRALVALPLDPWALATKGMMTAEGWGVPRDLPAGMTMLRQSAGAGFGPAMHALGMYYVNVLRQNAPARDWFRRAADLGQREDMFNIGLMDWNGEAAPRPDRAAAMAWWKRAAALGEERAIKALQAGRP